MDTNHQERLLNHFRIDQILARGGGQLQKVFKKRWMDYKNREWEDRDGIEVAGLCDEAVGLQIKEKLKNDKIDLWDITATCRAIQAISKEIPTKERENKAIHELRDARNSMAHGGKAEMSNDEFNQKWNHIANMLVKLGDSYADIKALKIELLKIGKSEDAASNVEPVKEVYKKEVKNKEKESESDASDSESYEANEDEAVVEPKEDEAQKLKENCKEDGKCDSKANDFTNAIDVYSKILQLPGIKPEDKAIIFNNRSVAYLSSKIQDSVKLAQKDAEWSIQLWPCGWRGYYRLAQVQKASEKYPDAEKSLENALALNPSSKEARDDLSVVRRKIGVLNRGEHLNSVYQFPSENDQLNDIHSRTGMSKKQAKKLLNKTMNLPVVGHTLRAKNYMLGKGVRQDFLQAIYHFEKAANAENPDPDAMYNLGLMYHEGRGIPPDFKKSLELLLKAANFNRPDIRVGSGIPEAQHLLGIKYWEGVGVDKNYQKACEWFGKAANHGFGASANNLGILYKQGQGVEKSLKKAFRYFKLAADLGDTEGMYNLGQCYLIAEGTDLDEPSEEYIAEGIKWLEISAKKGNMNAEKKLETFKSFNKDDMKMISLMNKMASQDSKDLLDKEQYGAAIKEAAKKGSITAQRHVNIWKNIELAMEAFKKKDSKAVVSALATAIRLDHQITVVPEILFPVIEERMKLHSDELETITCFIHIRRNRNNIVYLSAIDEYWPKFPQDKYLLEQRITSFIVSKQLDDALTVVNKALEVRLRKFLNTDKKMDSLSVVYPNSLRFLYCRVIALFVQDKQQEESLKALDAFLNTAPKDHDKVPGCYYRKAIYYHHLDNIPKFIESFEAGFAAEKKQLPCFLPYNFPDKTYLEKLYENYKTQNPGKQKQKPSKTTSISSDRNLNKIKTDAQRKFFIIKHRENFISNEIGETSIAFVFANKQNQQKLPKLTSLKNITLKEMNPTEDKCYEGFVLEARIVEWVCATSNITTLIEDKNGDLQSIIICNWPSNDHIEILKDLRPNSMISIINPHMRMSSYTYSFIEVQSRNHIQIDNTSAEKKCSCCGKEAKVLPCSKCLVSCYCSKECQIYDWKEFNHKDLCPYLKKYSDFINFS